MLEINEAKESTFMALVNEIKTCAKIIAKNNLSYEGMNALRKNMRKYKRRQRAKNMPAQEITLDRLKRDLQNSSLDPNRDIFVHSAFSTIGTRLKAEEIVQLILDYVGPETTVLMPAYPMPGNMIDWMSDSAPFDIAKSPSMMGIISEVFRKRPDVVRSAHPTHSVCAWGKNAKAYINDHHLCQAPCGKGSPFAKLAENKGQILCIGTGVGKITSYHVNEDIRDDFPVKTCLSESLSKTVLSQNQTFTVKTKVFNPTLSPWRIDNFWPKTSQFRNYMQRYGCLRSSKLGNASLDIVQAATLYEMVNDLAKEGVTIYHRPSIGLIRKICNFPY